MLMLTYIFFASGQFLFLTSLSYEYTLASICINTLIVILCDGKKFKCFE